MGDIGYSEPKKLLRDDISKSWTRAKEVSSMQKQSEFDPTKNVQFSKYDQGKNKSYGHEFLSKGPHNYRELPYNNNNNNNNQKMKWAYKEANSQED